MPASVRPDPGACLNASAYAFVGLDELARWRERIAACADESALKGTVLLAHEGINLVVAGAPSAVRGLFSWLRGHPPFTNLKVNESWSDAAPFGRFVVKIKNEIIRMNRPSIHPQAQRAPAVDAATLGRWLDAGHDDAGRPVVVLDTRNAFEVDAGRITGAVDWRLDRFSDFPAAFDAHRHELSGRTVVAYCTGGIRYEKAALVMAQAGLDHVVQLDGGILALLQRSGGAYFDGDCVVFDRRQALDTALRPQRDLVDPATESRDGAALSGARPPAGFGAIQ